MNAPTVTAGWPLPKLLAALARAGWADLDTGAAQGIRSTLRALGDVLPYDSATGATTTAQVADAAGLCTKWAARCLRYLEAAGLITWTRGQVIAGRPTPGHIRVNKRALADLVNRARRAIPERVRARAAETSKRIRETLRTGRATNRPGPPPAGRRGRAPLPYLAPPPESRPVQTPLSLHVELGSTPSPIGEEQRDHPPVKTVPPGTRRRQLLLAIERARQTGTS